MKVTLKVWRQKSASADGRFESYEAKDVSPDMSLLELLDIVNEQLVTKGEEPIAFDHDCREGICGACSMVVNGHAHGSDRGTTTCQIHMRRFADGDTLVLEPWRAKPFPMVRDLMVDRSAFDRIIASGGFVSVNTGGSPDANALPIGKVDADHAFDAAACIGCGACVAACKNASAMLFVAAKVGHLASLPQGQPERDARAVNMIMTMDREGFGACTNTYDCEAACPKEISVDFIGALNRDYRKALSSTR